jgi:hypothetical protein
LKEKVKQIENFVHLEEDEINGRMNILINRNFLTLPINKEKLAYYYKAKHQ